MLGVSFLVVGSLRGFQNRTCDEMRYWKVVSVNVRSTVELTKWLSELGKLCSTDLEDSCRQDSRNEWIIGLFCYLQ